MTCRQIHTEAELLPFTLNEFITDPPFHMCKLQSPLKDKQAQAISTIGVRLRFYHFEIERMPRQDTLVLLSGVLAEFQNLSIHGSLRRLNVTVTVHLTLIRRVRQVSLFSENMRRRLLGDLEAATRSYVEVVNVTIKVVGAPVPRRN